MLLVASETNQCARGIVRPRKRKAGKPCKTAKPKKTTKPQNHKPKKTEDGKQQMTENGKPKTIEDGKWKTLEDGKTENDGNSINKPIKHRKCNVQSFLYVIFVRCSIITQA